MSKHGILSPDKGFVPEFDIKEDEEQNVKLNQTVDLLLAAGYFRARIKGLSPFDKVVGGMTWCITTCYYDIDVDLLFQENSTIGQKIALTEKIVAVLPKMNCPYRIEPHQIQGLDFIHIFPVVQWLVKKAMETREEMGDYIRAYSISQFDKFHQMPEDIAMRSRRETAVASVETVKGTYKPQRKYKCLDSSKLQQEELRVQSTLLEYGKKYVARSEQDKSSASQSSHAPVAQGKDKLGEDSQEVEQKISALMSGLTATNQSGGRVAANTVGSIIGMQSAEIQQVSSMYAEKQATLEKLEKDSPKIDGLNRHKRVTSSLQKQIQQQNVKVSEMQEKSKSLTESLSDLRQQLDDAKKYSTKIAEESAKLSQMETEENLLMLQKLQHLVNLNESLKKQEQEFRAHCKEEKERLQQEIAKLTEGGHTGDAEESEHNKLIQRQHQVEREKLDKIRLTLAKKNREISMLHRKLDEIPSRAELAQYQCRFVELYNQSSTKHKETKQFYALHNTLDDTKLYLNKEVNLLNSIYETFAQAMESPSGKEQFLRQFEQIVEGVKQNRNRLEKRKQEEKMRRDQMNDEHLQLLEKQRIYFKTIRDFQEECHKNELLVAKFTV